MLPSGTPTARPTIRWLLSEPPDAVGMADGGETDTNVAVVVDRIVCVEVPSNATDVATEEMIDSVERVSELLKLLML